MPESKRSATASMTLTEVMRRLSLHTAVDGLIIIGSAADDTLTSASDYDLVIVLAEMPVPLHVGVTTIDGRFADLVFCTADQVEEILAATEPLDFHTWTGRLIGWLEEGKIAFDRYGKLASAQQKVQTGAWLHQEDAAGLHAWNRVNYNLQVVRRYLSTDDPRYLATADLRMMLYGPSDLFFSYFTVRHLRWAGEKAAIAYLTQNDSTYLEQFNHFLRASECKEKFRLYRALAAATVAPVGPLWDEESTVIMVEGDDVTPEMEQHALAFWEALILHGEDSSRDH